MKYYKLVQNNNIVGVVNSSNFVRYSPASDMFLRCNEERGEYITFKGVLYRDTWMQPIRYQMEYVQVLALSIEEEEYNILIEAFKTNEEIHYVRKEEEKAVQEEIITDLVEEGTVKFIKNSKLNEMSYACQKTIENGFDLELRGATHHFSLTTQDQLNLMSLGTMAQTSNEIPYHADGEDVIFYTSEEINQIIAAANAFKTYQTTYYNSLKAYINSLETIEEISAIEYGIEIPEKFKTEVLKALEHK